jgi:16S rRNA (adenine1518-N6/adenine1519-N6)-dimethyltransferase
MPLNPKKFLGQHFLKDKSIATRVVNALNVDEKVEKIIEIGPGTGILTGQLMQLYGENLFMIDLDPESVRYLKSRFVHKEHNIIHGDFLKLDLDKLCDGKIGIIGNFPYNISSQIFFKILENRNKVQSVVGMVQKEVGERIASGPGSKTYGILSVLLTAFYTIEYLFTVEPDVFHPPPKVRSAVIRLTRNNTVDLSCDEKLFAKIVKNGFQNRRKTLRNALKALNLPEKIRKLEVLDKRAEQLSVEDFVNLTLKLERFGRNNHI